MIHIATVHWELDDWVDIQLEYLNRHVREPFRVYAYLNRLKTNHEHKFFYSSTDDIESHPIKLNLLADHVMESSVDDDDLLIFIDGDAFPIDDIISYGRGKLNEFKLIAVQRKENFGDIQPHPCFCMTTVGFWKEIRGDWREGYAWQNLRGESMRDVGGNLLKLLEDNRVSWYPMLRSNRVNVHPLFFGVYDGVVYHHGAGFRRPYCRLDAVMDGKIYESGDAGLLKRRWSKMMYKWNNKKTKARNKRLSDEMFRRIRDDKAFYRELL